MGFSPGFPALELVVIGEQHRVALANGRLQPVQRGDRRSLYQGIATEPGHCLYRAWFEPRNVPAVLFLGACTICQAEGDEKQQEPEKKAPDGIEAGTLAIPAPFRDRVRRAYHAAAY